MLFRLHDFAYRTFRDWYTPTHGSVRGALTQTAISAWLASVPIVPVLRNDNWGTPLLSVHVAYKIKRIIFGHRNKGVEQSPGRAQTYNDGLNLQESSQDRTVSSLIFALNCELFLHY